MRSVARECLAALLRCAICMVLTLAGVAGTAGAASPSPGTCGDATLREGGGALAGSTPVLFVHGINSDPSMWNKGAEPMAPQIANVPGVTTWAFDYRKASLNWVTDQEIGDRLASGIGCLAHASQHKVIVVAHSMGGLATQYAVSRNDSYGGTAADDVAQVITVATPFRGSLVLSLAQGAIGGLESQASPLTVIGIEAYLSWCASNPPAARAAQSVPATDMCAGGLLSVLRSDVGTALMYGSAAIQALPPWPKDIPVQTMAGDISARVEVGVLGVDASIGDQAVTLDSATADQNVDGSPFPVNCSPGFSRLPLSLFGLNQRCSSDFHLNLPGNPEIVDRVRSTIAAIVASTGAPTTTPAADPCASTVAATAPPGWSLLPDTTVTAGADPGGVCITSPVAYWGGIHNPGTAGGDYTVSAEGRLENGSRGWALGARATIAADGTVTGHAIQYDPGAGGYRDVDYPDDTGPTTSAATDDGWHQLTITVQGTHYTEYVDGTTVATGTLPQQAESTGTPLVRVWQGSTVELRNLTVTPGPA